MGMREGKKKSINSYLGASLAERKSKLPPSSIIIANTFLVKNETTINIEISNVKGHGAKTGIQIKGLPERPLKNITLENIELTADEALVCSDAENINITNTRVRKGDAQ